MEALNGHISRLPQGRRGLHAGWGHRIDSRSKMDTLGDCRVDDCAGVGRIVSRTGAAMSLAGDK